MITIGREICGSFEESSSREWLETNGIGGFACSTISGANTRRYHGLLTAALKPPLGRVTTLSKFEETLVVGEERFGLSSNQFPGAVHPSGFQYLSEFRLDPFPIWTFEVGGFQIEKAIFMVNGENTTVCRWHIKNSEEKRSPLPKLVLEPLFSFSDYHSLQHRSDDPLMKFTERGNCITVRPLNDCPSVFVCHNARSIEKTGNWYLNFEYYIEKERGFDFREDLYQPFKMEFDLSKPAEVIISTKEYSVSNTEKLEKNESARRKHLVKIADCADEFSANLTLAADQFIVSRGEGRTIIAGYPWFSDWGRDTMISLLGLTLATNRQDAAKSIIREYSKHFSKGMLPNRFPDIGEDAEYNTVDATLWYFEAVRAYLEETGDWDFIESKIYPKLVESIVWHLKGTRYNIHVDTDGLLFSGEEGSQLTWMDAKFDDTVFTPRRGKPVEIQALWYNALRTIQSLADRFGDRDGAEQYSTTAEIAKESFHKAFWNSEAECLYDVVSNGDRDSSIRPNQIFAVSLHYSMLSIGHARKVVEKVESELLTPVGLRSLSPGDPAYRGTYIGSPLDRDSAYHQGTVWGWLIGPFIEAYRKVYPNGHQTSQKIKEYLSGFEAHLSEAGVGQISEIFDGDAPHHPRGCFAQAWSIAEVIRSLKAFP
ncbi:MAG: glycogen debranching enzyme family protein [Pyrinomonadaceae bacterium]|nr:glycogen debranching enzyme family protein [Pyrinomonadaceae bacterium]